MWLNVKLSTVCVVFAGLLFSNACTRNCQIDTNLIMPVQKASKIPLRVGLYMSPDFLSYTRKIAAVNTDSYVFNLGEALRSGSEKMLGIAFKEVIVLSPSEEAMERGVKIVVSPQIQEVDMIIPGWAWKQLKSLVIIKWEATDSTGRILWVDTFEGRSNNRVGYFLRGKAARKCMKRGVEDHFGNAFEGILNSTWWKTIK